MRALQPGEGLIHIVQKAFGDKSALVVTGGDADGVRAALHEMAERWPNLHARGKDRTTLDDVREDVRRCLSGRSPIGQAATALYKLDRLTATLAGRKLDSAAVHVYVEHPRPASTRPFGAGRQPFWARRRSRSTWRRSMSSTRSPC